MLQKTKESAYRRLSTLVDAAQLEMCGSSFDLTDDNAPTYAASELYLYFQDADTEGEANRNTQNFRINLCDEKGGVVREWRLTDVRVVVSKIDSLLATFDCSLDVSTR